MGFSKDKSLAILRAFTAKHQDMTPQERIVLNWCQTLIMQSDADYWSGVMDALSLAFSLLVSALRDQGGEDNDNAGAGQ